MLRFPQVCATFLVVLWTAVSDGQEKIEFGDSPLQGTLFAEEAEGVAAAESAEKTAGEPQTTLESPAPVGELKSSDVPKQGNFKAYSDSPELLGVLGNPDQFEIVGNSAYSSDSIRKAVSRDVFLSWYEFRTAKLNYYLHQLGRVVAEGYLFAGYAHVYVAAAPSADKSHLVLTIEEGERCTAGAIHVQSQTGAVNKPIEAEIVRALTAPSSPQLQRALRAGDWDTTRPAAFAAEEPADKAKWRPVCELGAPLKADWESLHALQRCVELACADLGYPYAFVSARWHVPGSAATLEVGIRDLGPRVGFKQLRLEGQSRTTEAEVIQFLGLEPGASLAPRTLAQFVQRLEDSGRFLAVQAHLERSAGKDDVALVIKVEEAPRAPALNDRLSEADAAVLRFGQWLADASRWEADLVAETRFAERDFQLVLAPTGALALVERTAEGIDKPWGLIDSRQISLSAPKTQASWSLPIETADIPTPHLTFALKLDRADPEQRAFNFGAGLGSNRGAEPPRIELSPSFCLDLLRRPGVTAKLAEGVWTITDPGKDRYVFEDGTGRGVSWECWLDEEATTTGTPSIRVRWEVGALEHRSDLLTRSMEMHSNSADPDRPVHSLAEFAFAEFMAGEETLPPACVRLLGQASVAFADELVSNWWGILSPATPDHDRFWIPSDAMHSMSRDSGWGSWYLAIASTSGELVPRETTAGAMLRYVGRLMCEDLFNQRFQEFCKNTARGELNSLFVPEAPTGPVVGWVLARMFDEPPELVKQILTRTDEEHLRNDFSGLLDQRGIVGRALGKAAETLRAADAETWTQAIELAPEEQRASCQAFADALLNDREKPIDAALLDALAAGWQAGWRTALEADLRPSEAEAE